MYIFFILIIIQALLYLWNNEMESFNNNNNVLEYKWIKQKVMNTLKYCFASIYRIITEMILIDTNEYLWNIELAP